MAADSKPVTLALAVVLRAACIIGYRIDSDEPQHLHASWLWSQGLVAYRDFFDNHTPLFHVLCAPLVAAMGETRQILLAGRLMMVPLALALTYLIARRLYDDATARWATLSAAVIRRFCCDRSSSAMPAAQRGARPL